MRNLYISAFGTDSSGNSTYEWTAEKESARSYDKAQADIDCDLLNRHSPERVTPENAKERLVFENFRVQEIAEGRFVISFESRMEAERIAYP